MILSEAENTVEDFSGLESKSFGFEMSPMISKILYTYLYEDKERVVLQELSSNALDAHIAVGKEDTPILVHLPTSTDPELRVEDFGVGMSLEVVEKNYTTWGASTKRDSNNEIGGFGYGSKTPLALAGSYVVETTHKGITTIFACYLKDDGDPVSAVTANDKMGREDGTIVRVPVGGTDVQDRLLRTVNYLFAFWPTKPNITGVSRSQLEDDVKVLETTPDYHLLRRNEHPDGNHVVTVGPVAYRIPHNAMEGVEESPEYAEVSRVETAEAVRVMLRFGVGDLDISPSRERIEPTKRNVKAIKSAYAKVLKSLQDKAPDASIGNYVKALESIRKHSVYLPKDANSTYMAFITREGANAVMRELGVCNPSKLLSLYISTHFYPLTGEDNAKALLELPTATLRSLFLRRIQDSNYLLNKYVGNTETNRIIAVGESIGDSNPTVTENIKVIKETTLRPYKVFDMLSAFSTGSTETYPSLPEVMTDRGTHRIRSWFLYSVDYNRSGRLRRDSQNSRKLLDHPCCVIVSNSPNGKVNHLCRELLSKETGTVYTTDTNSGVRLQAVLGILADSGIDVTGVRFYGETDVEEAYNRRPRPEKKKKTPTVKKDPTDSVVGTLYTTSNGYGLVEVGTITYKSLGLFYSRIDTVFLFLTQDKERVSYMARKRGFTGTEKYNETAFNNTAVIFLHASSANTQRMDGVVKELHEKYTVHDFRIPNGYTNPATVVSKVESSDSFRNFKEALETNNATLRMFGLCDHWSSGRGFVLLKSALNTVSLGEEKVIPYCSETDPVADKHLFGAGLLSDRLVGKVLRLCRTEDRSETLTKGELAKVRQVSKKIYKEENSDPTHS